LCAFVTLNKRLLTYLLFNQSTALVPTIKHPTIKRKHTQKPKSKRNVRQTYHS